MFPRSSRSAAPYLCCAPLYELGSISSSAAIMRLRIPQVDGSIFVSFKPPSADLNRSHTAVLLLIGVILILEDAGGADRMAPPARLGSLSGTNAPVLDLPRVDGMLT